MNRGEGQVVAWWNGIRPDTRADDSSIRWGADAEDARHDIPLYDGYNPMSAVAELVSAGRHYDEERRRADKYYCPASDESRRLARQRWEAALNAVESNQCRADDWRPIETAPRDGTEILAWSKGEGRVVTHWAGDWRDGFGDRHEGWELPFGTDVGACGPYSWAPTHWQPLPAEPTA